MTDQEALARGVALLPELKSDLEWFTENKSPSMMRRFTAIIAALEAAERIAKPASNGEAVVERVARALHKALYPRQKWEDLEGEAFRDSWRNQARAALSAINPEKDSP